MSVRPTAAAKCSGVSQLVSTLQAVVRSALTSSWTLARSPRLTASWISPAEDLRTAEPTRTIAAAMRAANAPAARSRRAAKAGVAWDGVPPSDRLSRRLLMPFIGLSRRIVLVNLNADRLITQGRI